MFHRRLANLMAVVQALQLRETKYNMQQTALLLKHTLLAYSSYEHTRDNIHQRTTGVQPDMLLLRLIRRDGSHLRFAILARMPSGPLTSLRQAAGSLETAPWQGKV